MESLNQSGVVQQLTADIVAAFVANNQVTSEQLTTLISDVHKALMRAPAAAALPEQKSFVPAVPIKKSVTSDYIISLEDGQKFKSLKRHLKRHYNMTPDEYRAKWGLPRDYPMVAPNYSRARSALAKSMGLGRKSASTTPAKKPARARKRAAKKRS
jgi:predicted transcriptional regulator